MYFELQVITKIKLSLNEDMDIPTGNLIQEKGNVCKMMTEKLNRIH